MKQVYNVLKEPVAHYLKKDILKEGVKAMDALIPKIKSLEIEDKVDIGISPNKELYEDQIVAYKPFITPKKLNDDFNYTNRFKLNNSDQFGIKRVGLNNVLYRQFSTKVDKMAKFADPTNDVAFKKIFSEGNIEGTKDFIESIIVNIKDYPFSSKLESIEFLNKDHMPGVLQGKKSLCDLKVKDDKGNTYIIEMQKRNEEDYLQRIQYYSAHAVTDQLEKGESHANIKPVITISIMGRNCFENDVPCISYHPYKETTTNKQLLLAQSHIFIELPKLKNSGLKNDTLEWLNMFKEAPNLDKLPSVKNEYVIKAYQKLEHHNWTKEEMDAYIDAKVSDDIEKNNIEHAIKKGKNERNIEIVRKMLSKGMDIKEIIDITGLSKEQVEEIKDKNS